MDKNNFYRESVEGSLNTLNSSKEGISSEEAKIRLEKTGKNELKAKKKQPTFFKYLAQFKDPMIILLFASALISAWLGDPRTAIVLIALVFLNTFIGFFQEFRAEKTMQALEKLVNPSAEVFRDGKLAEIDAKDLVPGDVIRMSEGDSIPADVRIISESAFFTNDFALTGESNPSKKFTHAIEKNVPLNNRHNQAFMGTSVSSGEAYGLVIATGMNTELGKIANLSSETKKEKSPLQKELGSMTRIITIGVMILFVVLIISAIVLNLPFKEALIFAVGFASSLIPQGLPAEINTNLAQSASKLSRAKALVKKLSSVETLGATSVICTDKTGTLTKNEMTVETAFIGEHILEITGSGYAPEGEILINKQKVSKDFIDENKYFFLAGALASNAKVLPPDENHKTWYCLGDPTEGALITFARKAGFDLEKFQNEHAETREFPFDSSRKMMTSVYRLSETQAILFTKGAPESVLERCVNITAEQKQFYLDKNISQAEEAMRNLAYAMKIIPIDESKNIKMEDAEKGLTMLGMISMIDPIREAVPEAVRVAQEAQIKLNIVTGDFALTAKAIAKKAGIKEELIKVISGEELNSLPDDILLEAAKKGDVIFSRVNPEDKLRIVNLLSNSGFVVAVTGDGINDAPALKRADIGVAMGITGTDVAKDSADIILLDDSFSTLVKAIDYGRTIFANIQKSTLACLTTNAAELIINLISLAGALMFNFPLAITIMQLLSIDLLAELLPISALGWDKAEGDLIKNKPRNLKDHILNKNSILDFGLSGLMMGTLAYFGFAIFIYLSGENMMSLNSGSEIYLMATSVSFLMIVISQFFNIMSRRSTKGIFTKYQFHNKFFWSAILISFSLTLLIIYSPINEYFGCAPLNLLAWGIVLAGTAIFVAFRQIQILFFRDKKSNDIVI